MTVMSDGQVRQWRDLKGGGYAYFPGTGPEFSHCEGCRHYTARTKKGRYIRRDRCLKARDFNAGKFCPEINPQAPACKYFDPVKRAKGSRS